MEATGKNCFQHIYICYIVLNTIKWVYIIEIYHKTIVEYDVHSIYCSIRGNAKYFRYNAISKVPSISDNCSKHVFNCDKRF